MLASIVNILQTQTTLLTVQKAHAHANIKENEIKDDLTIVGNKKEHCHLQDDYEHAHPFPFYLHKDDWFSPLIIPYKGPIQFLESYLIT